MLRISLVNKIGKRIRNCQPRVINKVGTIAHETACQHSLQSALVEYDADSLAEKIDYVFTIYEIYFT